MVIGSDGAVLVLAIAITAVIGGVLLWRAMRRHPRKELEPGAGTSRRR